MHTFTGTRTCRNVGSTTEHAAYLGAKGGIEVPADRAVERDAGLARVVHWVLPIDSHAIRAAEAAAVVSLGAACGVGPHSPRDGGRRCVRVNDRLHIGSDVDLGSSAALAELRVRC